LKISTAVIGLGKVGLTYDLDVRGNLLPDQVMTHCRAISLSDFFQLGYLVDPNFLATQTAVNLYGGLASNSIHAKDSIGPAFVVVSVPTPNHLQIIESIIETWSPDTYLIEKPFGSSLNESRKIQELLRNQDARVYINYFRRYLPNFTSLKTSSIFQNRGKLLNVTINGYGTLLNIFSHFLDLIIYFESPSILGTSEKTKFSVESGSIRFIDPSTGISFELNGVGQSYLECEMTLRYENFEIFMFSNGRCLEISSLDRRSLETFELDVTTFSSYQTFVLKHIEEEFFLSRKNTSIDDAIRIHEFLESIELTHAIY
jgi:predicted dehydrogenase